MLPQASGSPAERRATRAVLRRRTHVRRTRADLCSPGHHTTSPYPVPEMGKTSAEKANRAGVAARFADPAVHQTIAVDLTRLSSDDARRRDVQLSLRKAATHHDAPPLSLVHTVPGIGTSRSLVRLDDLHQIDRFPSVQDLASSCRLVTCAKASGSTRVGTSGTTRGNAPLTGAFSDAAALCLRHHAASQHSLARWATKPATGKAVPSLAHTLARAVSDRLTRQTACARGSFLRPSGSRASEPGPHGQARCASPCLCLGRSEGTAVCLGRRVPSTVLCTRHTSGACTSIRVWCSHVRWAPEREIQSEHDTDC